MAGMYTEASSNGIVIDVSPPQISRHLSLSSTGTIVPNTIIMRSAVKVLWSVADPESSIEAQYLSMSSHIGGDFNETTFKVSMFLLFFLRSYIILF